MEVNMLRISSCRQGGCGASGSWLFPVIAQAASGSLWSNARGRVGACRLIVVCLIGKTYKHSSQMGKYCLNELDST